MKKNKNSTYNKYLSVFYIFFVLSLLAVALFNFKIDPENIYKKFSKNQKEEESFSISYVKKLINSKTGLFYRNDLSTKEILSTLYLRIQPKLSVQF